MMRKRWKALTLVLLLALCATGCSKKLSDRFDRDALEEKVSTVISLAVQGDYDTLYEEEFSQQIITQIDQESLKTAVDEVIGPLGEFQEIQKITYMGDEDKDTETPYAIAVAVVQFQEGKAQFTLSFNLSMKCIGFWIK